jgi:hypothetical protein
MAFCMVWIPSKAVIFTTIMGVVLAMARLDWVWYKYSSKSDANLFHMHLVILEDCARFMIS